MKNQYHNGNVQQRLVEISRLLIEAISLNIREHSRTAIEEISTLSQSFHSTQLIYTNSKVSQTFLAMLCNGRLLNHLRCGVRLYSSSQNVSCSTKISYCCIDYNLIMIRLPSECRVGCPRRYRSPVLITLLWSRPARVVSVNHRLQST